MDLPVKYQYKEDVVSGIRIVRPKGLVFAETRKTAEGGDFYSALVEFISGSTDEVEMESGNVVSDKTGIKAAIRNMPYVDANWLSIQILLQLEENSIIDGVWNCPRCKHQFFSDPEFPDRVEDLGVTTAPDVVTITRDLMFPVEIKSASTGDPVVSVSSVEIRLPTLSDCSRAYRLVGGNDYGKLQFAIYGQATLAANGVEVDDKWRNQWGLMVYERMDGGDLKDIANMATEYGMDETLPKRCPKCSKEWDAPVDVSGFFVDGLRAN